MNLGRTMRSAWCMLDAVYIDGAQEKLCHGQRRSPLSIAPMRGSAVQQRRAFGWSHPRFNLPVYSAEPGTGRKLVTLARRRRCCWEHVNEIAAPMSPKSWRATLT